MKNKHRHSTGGYANTGKRLGDLLRMRGDRLIGEDADNYLINHTCNFKYDKPVILSEKIVRIILQLMDEFPHIEWMMYLGGITSPEGDYITRYLFPEQMIQTGYCEPQKNGKPYSYIREFKNKYPDMDVVYTIHSHHTMGVFASKTDEDNILVSADGGFVVSKVNGNLNIGFWKKVHLPCGAWDLIRDDNIKVDNIVKFEEKIEFNKGIMKKTRRYIDLKKANIDISLANKSMVFAGLEFQNEFRNYEQGANPYPYPYPNYYAKPYVPPEKRNNPIQNKKNIWANSKTTNNEIEQEDNNADDLYYIEE